MMRRALVAGLVVAGLSLWIVPRVAALFSDSGVSSGVVTMCCADGTPTATPTPSPCPPPFTPIAANDTDCDGAPDAAEDGADPFQCGVRNKYDPWDFYDVPAPSIASGGDMSNRDSAVTTLSDMLAVLEYSATMQSCAEVTTCGLSGNTDPCCSDNPNSAGIDWDWDMDGDTYADGLAYDRSLGAVWSGPPDGAVSILTDVLLVLAQTGTSCAP